MLCSHGRTAPVAFYGPRCGAVGASCHGRGCPPPPRSRAARCRPKKPRLHVKGKVIPTHGFSASEPRVLGARARGALLRKAWPWTGWARPHVEHGMHAGGVRFVSIPCAPVLARRCTSAALELYSDESREWSSWELGGVAGTCQQLMSVHASMTDGES